jgi:U6 snRNA-associated Sm-like protein LSm3
MSKDLISQKIEQPMEYLLHCVGKNVCVELKTGNILKGMLHAYDEHLNLLLSKVKEFTEDDMDECFREMSILYVRGDMVTLVNKQYRK